MPMKRILSYIFFITFLVSCSNEIPEREYAQRSNRTVLAYLIANNANTALDDYLKENISWMYRGLAETKDTCTLLVYYRPSQNDPFFNEPTIMRYETDGYGNINGHKAITNSYNPQTILQEAEILRTYPDINHTATDPEIMQTVLNDMRILSTTTKYGVIFGSHASSWLPAFQIQTFAFGDDKGQSIDIPDMANAIKQAFPNEKIDFILFDACMMGTAEVCYELRNVTNYCIASVMETSVLGFPYHLFMSELYEEKPDFQEICDDFVSFNQEQRLWGTCAAFDCSKMEKFALNVKQVLTAYKDVLPTFDFYNDNVQQYGGGSYQYFSLDVGDFFRVLNGGTIPSTIQDAINETVIAKNCLSGRAYAYNNVVVDESRFCGIGMYCPFYTENLSWNLYYANDLAWYYAAGWNNILPTE